MSVLSKSVNRRIGQAMHDYGMLADMDRVLIAVSGGVDSLVLTWLLNYWRRKAPIHYEILAVHIDNGFDSQMGDKVEKQLQDQSALWRQYQHHGPQAETFSRQTKHYQAHGLS
jgi:tRNA(Ile)-lysidine synthase TilS/MesJ